MSGVETVGVHADAHRDSWQVRAQKQITYEVRFRDDVFGLDSTDLLEAGADGAGSRRRFVVVDSAVDALYGSRIREYFTHHGIDHSILVMRVGETVKDFDTAGRIVAAMDAFGLARRREPMIVVGGGVLMDVAGLVASLYRRGTPFLRVPTTLVGLIDAGVGAKTGVNFNGHKNRLGTYAPADLTLLDRRFLATLDRRHLSNGLAEMLKIALIKDAELFQLLERHGRVLIEERFQGRTGTGDRAAVRALRAATHGMLEELGPNLWESRLERSVDYGHTFSPTIEMRALPALLHGEAVCVDMALTTVLAYRRGLLDVAQRDRIFAVMTALGLPTWHPLLTPEVLEAALQDTVRHRDGWQRLPLPVGIGGVTFVNDVTAAELQAAALMQHRLAEDALLLRA
ncbi:2-epi-5-epi-valiolone synthase [Actinoplanes sp. SE50]|uniref:2-epi-5-epi-valiolone synthase n=1 Tax=Actinoplanes sp. (strain ATCC 31044 / CBS 674.73 / SE50/110) TaxID=134676 RepID=ACBC_ACTS5|nr:MULTISPECIES: sedoheptulose 7-phosphate cyclase [unclassified Actinoplanes]Q9ZAE9.3 RecName: Full=2-epi-5-epi-valiolone synthase; Short=EEVS; AltName: Full=C7-cyclitol synthase; AltName: Full=Sedoheptulose 7-phosphate cyclase [Actinoplanes sp. SE50/110]AEV84575.1 2-epi-5-epi-valiolone synthase [Actinoplanes sp. SE50/110]ATO82967.1 2-epi-5-epi-valiolone synthase [Actinoplanes sp. SE50]SLM00375.1 2-epi-5-epi-valiolone synthase [Actinoplanes sp. SE50/110]